MKRSLLTLAILASTAALTYSAQYPRPQGPVSDFAGVIDSANSDKINAVIAELEQKTSAEIAVVTVKNLEGDTVDNYAVNLFKEWGIGKKGKDNGVLILAAIEDRKARIEVGYGLEGVINDARAGDILRTYLFPNFRKGNYGEGLYDATYSAAKLIADEAGVTLTGSVLEAQPEGKVSKARIVFQLIIFLIALVVFIRHPILFLLFLNMGGRGRSSGGGFGGGGFGGGGFGGGMSGGGGASGGW